MFCPPLLKQMLGAEKEAGSWGVLQKLLLSLFRRSSWRCSVGSGPPPSAPHSAFLCWHQSHTDSSIDSCSLAQLLCFTRAEISVLQNFQDKQLIHNNASREWDFLNHVLQQGHCRTERSKQIHHLHRGSPRMRPFSAHPLADAPFSPCLFCFVFSLRFLIPYCPAPLECQHMGTSHISTLCFASGWRTEKNTSKDELKRWQKSEPSPWLEGRAMSHCPSCHTVAQTAPTIQNPHIGVI